MKSRDSDVTLTARKRRIVYLIRHAQAHHNVSAEATSKYDPVLTETGITQAVVLRSIFQAPDTGLHSRMHLVLTIDGRDTTFCIPEPRLIVASPFRRTLQTAALLFGNRPADDGPDRQIIALPVIQESGQLNCDTGSPLDTLRKEFGTVSITDESEDSDRPARRVNERRLSSAEKNFQKHCPRLPAFDFSQIDDPEWYLQKRKQGDNPFQRAWEFKECLWQLFDAIEAEEEAKQLEEGLETGKNESKTGIEAEILGPIAVVTHGGFLKSMLTWDNGEYFTPFANAEIRAFEVRAAEIDPAVVKGRASAKGGKPLVHEVHEDTWTVLELEQLSMEELAKIN